MVELKAGSESLETMPGPQPQSHHSFTVCFPVTRAAFAVGCLCRADPKLNEVSGSPLTDFQQALDQSN